MPVDLRPKSGRQNVGFAVADRSNVHRNRGEQRPNRFGAQGDAEISGADAVAGINAQSIRTALTRNFLSKRRGELAVKIVGMKKVQMHEGLLLRQNVGDEHGNNEA